MLNKNCIFSWQMFLIYLFAHITTICDVASFQVKYIHCQNTGFSLYGSPRRIIMFHILIWRKFYIDCPSCHKCPHLSGLQTFTMSIWGKLGPRGIRCPARGHFGMWGWGSTRMSDPLFGGRADSGDFTTTATPSLKYKLTHCFSSLKTFAASCGYYLLLQS